jgi:hypothetical protein
VSADLTGTWEIVDVVEFGQDAGSTYRFVVTLSHDGQTVTGSGGGLAIEGRLEDGLLTAAYSRPGGTGVFQWTIAGGGDSFAGAFEDYAAGNGGSSTLVRVQ